MSIETADTLPPGRPVQNRQAPRGIGMYISDLSQKVTGTPEQAAKRAADAGLGFVALLGCWQEADRSTPANIHDLDDYGAAFREAGVDVFVWGYPHGTQERVEQFIDTMADAAAMAGAVGWILDPELGFKAERAAWMKPLLERTIDSLHESLGLGLTSYGLTSAHKDFPWDVCGGYGWGSPQLYTVPLDVARKAIAQWRAHGWDHIVASVPTYGPNSSEKLAAYSGAILEHCEGLIFWQWATTSAQEWRAIETLARDYHQASPARAEAL